MSYLPIAIFARPLWQELDDEISIHAYPFYLMVKSAVQVLLVVLEKTLKRNYAIYHAWCFMAVMCGMLMFEAKFPPYNYGRLGMWECLSLVAVIWISSHALLRMHLDTEPDFPWLASIAAGWIVILIIGIIIQKYKFPPRRVADVQFVNTIFRFAFGRHSVTADHVNHQLQLSNTTSRILDITAG